MPFDGQPHGQPHGQQPHGPYPPHGGGGPSGCPFLLQRQQQQQQQQASEAAAAAEPAASTSSRGEGGRGGLLWGRAADVGRLRLSRRELRRSGRAFTLAEVGRHRCRDDGWIAVGGSVYDITEHVASHPEWDSAGAGGAALASILAHLGSDCTDEFVAIHRPWPVATRQLQSFYIGELAPPPPMHEAAAPPAPHGSAAPAADAL